MPPFPTNTSIRTRPSPRRLRKNSPRNGANGTLSTRRRANDPRRIIVPATPTVTFPLTNSRPMRGKPTRSIWRGTFSKPWIWLTEPWRPFWPSTDTARKTNRPRRLNNGRPFLICRLWTSPSKSPAESLFPETVAGPPNDPTRDWCAAFFMLSSLETPFPSLWVDTRRRQDTGELRFVAACKWLQDSNFLVVSHHTKKTETFLFNPT